MNQNANQIQHGQIKTVKDKDRALNIAKNPKYHGYQQRLASMIYKCFVKKSCFTWK